jgi:hypothetical protein
MIPLLKGGQGRTDRDIAQDGGFTVWLTVAALVLIVLLAVTR